MFHFRCPTCAASPKPIPLRDYLASWGSAPPERLYSLLSLFSGALDEVVQGESRWLTKKFCKAAGKVHETLAALPFDPPLKQQSHLRPTSGSLVFDSECPVCRTSAGPREPDNYFTDWRHACKVQTGNLLYETGLILWAFWPCRRGRMGPFCSSSTRFEGRLGALARQCHSSNALSVDALLLACMAIRRPK
jgi:hypothetical protein